MRIKQDWSLLPNLGLTSSIAPALIIKGNTNFAKFPEFLGKNSSMRKAKRLIRELKIVMGNLAQASRLELQNDYVDLILSMVYKSLKAGKDGVPDAVDTMENLGLSNENLREHLMGLSMDSKLNKAFDELDSQVKSAFTREYNKRNASNTTGITRKIKGKPKAPSS